MADCRRHRQQSWRSPLTKVASPSASRSTARLSTRLQLAPISDLVLSSVIETEPEGEGLGRPAALSQRRRRRPHRPRRSRACSTRCSRSRKPAAGSGRIPDAPRTLDLDLDSAWRHDRDGRLELQVPHPRFRERTFVLGPLAEMAPDMVDPVTGLTVVRTAAEAAGRMRAASGGRPRKWPEQRAPAPAAPSTDVSMFYVLLLVGRRSDGRAAGALDGQLLPLASDQVWILISPSMSVLVVMTSLLPSHFAVDTTPRVPPDPCRDLALVPSSL